MSPVLVQSVLLALPFPALVFRQWEVSALQAGALGRKLCAPYKAISKPLGLCNRAIFVSIVSCVQFLCIWTALHRHRAQVISAPRHSHDPFRVAKGRRSRLQPRNKAGIIASVVCSNSLSFKVPHSHHTNL